MNVFLMLLFLLLLQKKTCCFIILFYKIFCKRVYKDLKYTQKFGSKNLLFMTVVSIFLQKSIRKTKHYHMLYIMNHKL